MKRRNRTTHTTNTTRLITRLQDNKKKLVNHYSSLNFDAQFAARAADLYEVFNYTVLNRQLQGIDVTGEGRWIKVWITKDEVRRLSPRSRKQLQNILDRHLYPGRSYRWGQFKEYIALGPRTMGAKKQWGGNNNYRVLRFH